MLQVSVHNEVAWRCPLPSAICKALISYMLSPYAHLFAKEQSHIVLHIVSDARIILLNTSHMHCMGPTNILSFPAHEESGHTPVPAIMEDEPKHPDILVLSVDTLQRECILYGQDIQEHAVRLLAHGLGHLLGYEHSEEMFALCTEMEELGREFLVQEGSVFI